ncbi:glycosyltransferase family 2 protein [Mixia osmundae IAM 14324]|uniref:glycosyltransferase family 2 protein n=1 Tax=Mixia osmundae (strain CBS 9802 / IAM 14324 / JCM 22182 / KY 12970) TaxID=764103 RepID=UPI0004A551AB|nr:glycosyltransferase family 2 protein [Mixia osmundae IAM 14324]KEI41382.1 glycosyltransferase family 2 protein [Mixia osmundae IAM 14324]
MFSSGNYDADERNARHRQHSTESGSSRPSYEMPNSRNLGTFGYGSSQASPHHSHQNSSVSSVSGVDDEDAPYHPSALAQQPYHSLSTYQQTSRPGTPGLDASPDRRDTDRTSNGSSNSSGEHTKVDSRSPSEQNLRDPHRESDASHYDNEGMYNQRSNDSTAYIGSPVYPPGSPTSGQSHNGMFGQVYGSRYRQGSYTTDSARASTILNDQIQTIPYNNSSRVALNSEWRSSVGSDLGGHHKDALYGTGKEGFDSGEMAILDPDTKEKSGGKGSTYVSLPPGSPTMNEKGGFPASPTKAEPAIVLSRVNRLAWIDGLRGLASIVIFTHHFADLTWSRSHPDTLAEGSVYFFIRNGQLAVCMYFLLGGRVLAHSFLKSAFAVPKVPKDSHGVPIPGAVAPKMGSPKWLTLSSSLFRRSIRLALPAIAIGFIQWVVAKSGIINDTPIQAATMYLQPSDLWAPTWNYIGNFWGFLQFVLDLFTNNNHQYMLAAGSALWTTYNQFWGSVLVYIVAATVAPLAWRGRYLLYSLILLALWHYSSPNFLYIAGLWLADAHAAGFIRKIQDHWMPTVAIEICVMAIALAFIAGGGKVATPANNAIASISINDGKYGYDATLVWPQLMLMANWIPPTMIIIWIELSHAMQWFASWGIFVWIGKVSYGFYLMQFLTLYGIMPHLIIHFASQGKSYWDYVIPAYILSLLFNFVVAWVAYHVLDRLGLKLGKWIWDGFFVTKPKNASALPYKMVRAFGHWVVHQPGESYRDMVNGTASSVRGFIKTCKTIRHWRSPAVRPVIVSPTDPDLLAQLHSTRWTADLSQDREAVRTARLLNVQQYAWLVHIWLIPAIAGMWVYFHPTGGWTFDGITFSTLWRFIWILSVPNCLAAYIGFCTPDRAPSKKVMDKKPVCREHIRNFFILLVTKGSNEGAVRRGYNKLIKLEKYHPAVKVILLSDEPYSYPDLQNVVCPKAYKSPLGKAKYKARALDYFRYHVSLGVYDWILHMDEESVTDGESLRRCMDFIRYTPHHFGQGIILYNGEGFWNNWYFTVADGIRVGDDLARFHFQNSVIHRPVFGVHGSFLMTSGEMENECTWDFGSLAEDFEFSQDAWNRGFTCGRIHGIVREQSPTSLRDFLKQRRRWFMGIRDIKGLYGLPNLAINLWIVGVFTLAVTIINLPFVIIDSSKTPLWIAICADFCFITFYTLYLWGILFQELDAGTKWWKICIHMPCSIVIQPFASVAEGLSAIWAMSSEDFGKFEVIVKK